VTLVSINNIGKDFGIKPLFSEVTLVLNDDERVALLGQNGSGKSTLLKMIAGLETPDSGEIVKRRDLLISYVKQLDRFEQDDTPLSIMMNAGHGLADFEARRLLEKAGFTDLDSPIEVFSGGWRKRLKILEGLAAKPDLLLLDEPTNHLDIPGILWLEDQLTAFSGACLFVSHDRFFVERVAARTIELDSRLPGGYVSAPGGYSALVEKREETLSALRSHKASLSNKVRREVEWLRAGVKARTTKSKSRIDEAHRMIDDLNKMQFERQAAELGFAASGRKTKELIKLEDTSGGYPEKKLWKDLSLTIYPGSRIGIVGANGAGKTTLLKTLLGDIPVLQGRVLRASNLKINFFGQMRETLNPEMTVKQTLAPDSDAVVFQNREIHVVTWARRFLFHSDQLASRVSELSGGEQARLLLAKVSLLESDILVFDEPTNDLDIQTLEILEQSFIEYPGAIIIVSHDRYMMARVCTEVVGFLPNAEVVRLADYAQFEIEWDESSKTAKKNPSIQSGNESKQTQAKSTLTFNEKKELQSLERKIQTSEAKIATLQAALHLPENATHLNKLLELQADFDKVTASMNEMMARWLELSEK
jgi:ATP-binding cassette subfamily F protein uup